MRRLILHLDLNRTVLMSDAAAGRSMRDVVNYLLAECCWGRASHGEWEAVDPRPAAMPSDAGLISYKHHVDGVMPFLKLDDPLPEGATDRLAANKAIKSKRMRLQNSFTEEGQPGEGFAAHRAAVLSALDLPESARDQARVLAGEDAGMLADTWRSGRWFLLPSFFALLRYAQQQHALDVMDTRIVLRSFGTDGLEVARELQLFCEGRHPCFPEERMDGSDGRLDMRLSPPFACFHRVGPDSQDSALVVGALANAPLRVPATEAALRAYHSEQGRRDVSVHVGFPAMTAALGGIVSDRRLALVRDCWEYWHSCGEVAEAGKPLMLQEGRVGEEEAPLQVFLDDHIEHDDAHIVDVRDCATGRIVPYEQTCGRHVVRVEPYLAITDEHYLVSLVEAACRALAGGEGGTV